MYIMCANTRIYFEQEWKTASSAAAAADRMRKKNISVSGALNILRSFSANFLPIRVYTKNS